MKLQRMAGLLTVASMFAIGGQPGLWTLPHWLEMASLSIFTLGFGYFVVWQSYLDLKSSKSVDPGQTCPTCGQKLTADTVAEEDDEEGASEKQETDEDEGPRTRSKRTRG